MLDSCNPEDYMFIEIRRKSCELDGVVFYFHVDFAIIIGILWILKGTNDLKLGMQKNWIREVGFL